MFLQKFLTVISTFQTSDLIKKYNREKITIWSKINGDGSNELYKEVSDVPILRRAIEKNSGLVDTKYLLTFAGRLLGRN